MKVCEKVLQMVIANSSWSFQMAIARWSENYSWCCSRWLLKMVTECRKCFSKLLFEVVVQDDCSKWIVVEAS